MSLSEVLRKLDAAQSTCFSARISALKSRGKEAEHIERGISDVLAVLSKGARSFVIYGEPQSGKTEFMIALACKLIDLGKKTIFVVMNDNTELEVQNFDRFHAAPELNPSPLRDFQLQSMDDDELRLDKQRIIFCRKNSNNLQKLIQLCRYMTDRVIIDDEADFATPNAKINKQELTKINECLGTLGRFSSSDSGIYIGVTATPARLDLNNTFLNDSRDWVFLRTHSNYKGRSFFFPVSPEEVRASDYVLVKLPATTDDPKLLRNAIFRFLIRVAILNVNRHADPTAYSMLIHTAGKTNDHDHDQKELQKVLLVLSDRNHPKFSQYVETELLTTAQELIQRYRCTSTAIELVTFVLRSIGKHDVLVINSKNDARNVKRACEPNAMFTFAIGGNIVSRGLTFESLLTFYFSRTVKGRLQQNTYIQRARMFGSRPYSKYFELCVPESLFNDWANCFQEHELSLRLAKAGIYQHIQSGKVAVVDRGAIDLQNVTAESSERAVGSLFELTPEIENAFLSCEQTKVLTCIKELLERGLLSDENFPDSLMKYLLETTRKDESGIHLVLVSETGGKKSIQSIERYADGDPATITRRRGGIIHAMLNKRKEYSDNNHFLLPIKNKAGKARLLYKSNLGHTILQNLKVHTRNS